jgi:hypothetical protein
MTSLNNALKKISIINNNSLDEYQIYATVILIFNNNDYNIFNNISGKAEEDLDKIIFDVNDYNFYSKKIIDSIVSKIFKRIKNLDETSTEYQTLLIIIMILYNCIEYCINQDIGNELIYYSSLIEIVNKLYLKKHKFNMTKNNIYYSLKECIDKLNIQHNNNLMANYCITLNL